MTVYHNRTLYKAIIPEDGSSFAFTKVLDTAGPARQVSYDPVNKKIYWIEDAPMHMIARCNLDGGNVERYETATDPWGISLDYKNKIIYYSDYTSGGVNSLAVADFTTPNSATLVDGTVGQWPRQIAFGSETSSLYVAQSGISQVVRYTGSSSPSVLFSSSQGDTIARPTGIFVDEVAQKLFYSDHDESTIYSYNLEDRTKTMIYKGLALSEPRGLSVYGDDIYFCDFGRDTIYKIDKNGMDYPDRTTPVEFTIDGSAPMGNVLDGVSDMHFFIEPVACVSNVVAVAASAESIFLTWDIATSHCPADVYKVQYEVTNADQCLAPSRPQVVTKDWQSGHSFTLTELRAFTSYKITVISGLRDLSDSRHITAGNSIEVYQDTKEYIPSAPPDEIQLDSLVGTTAIFSWNDVACGFRNGHIKGYSYRLTSEPGGQVILTDETVNKFVVLDHGTLFDVLPCGWLGFGVVGITEAGTATEFGKVQYQMISSEPFAQGSTLTISSIGQTSAVISWSRTECQPSDYTVSYTMLNMNQCQTVTQKTVSHGTVSNSSVTLVGLAPGSTYEVTVSGSSKEGSQRTLSATFTTLQSKPTGTPSNLRSHQPESSITTITWDEMPCEFRHGTITSYHYKVFLDDNLLRSGQAQSTTIDLADLPCGVVTFHVAGENEAGVSENFSEIDVETQSSDPFKAGSELKVSSVTETSAQLSWDASRCPPSPCTITYALMNLEGCDEVSSVVSQYGHIQEQTATLTGLLPGSTYKVTVSGLTKSGNLAVLEAEFATQDGVPLQAPTNIRLVASNTTTLTFTWDEVPCGKRSGLIKYETRLEDSSTGAIISSQQMSSTTVMISGLLSDTTYGFHVLAATSAGSLQSGSMRSTTRSSGSKSYSLQLTISELDNQPPVCLPQYAESNSAEFIQLSSRFTGAMDVLLRNVEGFRSTQLNSIKCGSLVMEFTVYMDRSSDISVNDVVNIINTEAGMDGDIGDNIVIKTDNSELCPVGFCPADIECIADISNSVSLCRCSPGVIQARCNDTTANMTIVYFIVGISIVVLIFLCVILTIWICLRRVRQPTLTLNGTRSPRDTSTISRQIASPWGIHQRQMWNTRFK